MGPFDPPPVGSRSAMAVLRLFAAARTAAGTARDLVPGETVGALIASAVERYGEDFAAVVPTCAVWVNGEPAGPDRLTMKQIAGVCVALGHALYRDAFSREMGIPLPDWDRRVFAAWSTLAPA